MKTANITNIKELDIAITKAKNIAKELPKLITFSGYSGFGKTYSAAFNAIKHNCCYIEIGASWTTKVLIEKLILESGGLVKPKGNLAEKVDLLVEIIKETGQILIIDEFDHIAHEKPLNIIREIHDRTNNPIILIGEENLPHKLASFERFHNRVADWITAKPCSLVDAKVLAEIYAPKLQIKEDLLKQIVLASGGRTRRVCVNIARIRDEANLNGWKEVGQENWKKEKLFTGKAPTPRRIRG